MDGDGLGVRALLLGGGPGAARVLEGAVSAALLVAVREELARGAEFVGEVVANLFGLTESKYQWVIDAQRDEERREKQRKLEDSQRRMLAERAFAEREATEQAARRAEGDVEHRTARRRRRGYLRHDGVPMCVRRVGPSAACHAVGGWMVVGTRGWIQPGEIRRCPFFGSCDAAEVCV